MKYLLLLLITLNIGACSAMNDLFLDDNKDFRSPCKEVIVDVDTTGASSDTNTVAETRNCD
jgi:hypothetical protein